MKTLSAIRTIVRQFLRDEFSQTDLQWEDDELDLYIADCLAEISEGVPYEVKEALRTTASSKELDISSIEDFLGLDGEHEIEYPIGSEPPNYHNASIFGNTLRMTVDRVPGAGEDVYLYCHKVHQLTESSSTLKPQLERLLILGVTARAAIAKAQFHINRVNLGGGRTPSELQGWGVSQLTLYQAGLKSITKPKTYRTYSKS